MPQKNSKHYQHDNKTVLRPEGGAQGTFPKSKRKPPKVYRFDSSLSPELCWDENPSREEGERFIADILAAESLDKAKEAAERLKNMSAPFLNWAGKAERDEFTALSLPLFVHERLSTDAVLNTLERHKRNRQTTLELFGEGQKSIGDAIRGAYEHLNGWQNRLILGDSLQVMNSLLAYENMGGKTQMVYMDPPYGIKFGSNFMPFVRKREVKDGDDNSITREPEMVQAYRDTWELGIHSWLAYMRDRLLLAREMLADSGSCFVQISDENVHFVRAIMDEVFGRENFISLITMQKTTSEQDKHLASLSDYLIWYAKDINKVKFNNLYAPRSDKADARYNQLQMPDGFRRSLSNEEKFDISLIPDGAKLYRLDNLTSSRPAQKGDVTKFAFEDKTYTPGKGTFKTDLNGLKMLEKAKRLCPTNKGTLNYLRFKSDFAFSKLGNLWEDISGAVQSRTDPKIYTVQTGTSVVQRCMLMTTDPGDLVFDPTCGSGTTAYIAEQWGRRWITADVSRVPIALARQRLLTATYDYYRLKDEKRGPAGGFVYKRKQNKKGEEIGGIVPHITLKSIANSEPPPEEILVDKPEKDSKFTRITGPFCVEAVMPPALMEDDNANDAIAEQDGDHIARMTEILRLTAAIQLPDNQTLTLKNIRPPAKTIYLHAEAQTDNESIAIIFGATNAVLSERATIDAAREARHKNFSRLLVIAFGIEPAARKTIEQMEEIIGIPALYAQASADLTMGDLLKNMKSSQIFAVCGLPDAILFKSEEKNKDGEALYQVELRGLDIFDPIEMTTLHKGGDDVPCWMLDPDYDGQCFRAGQVFFPRTNAWDKIKKAIKADFATSVWEHLSGATSAPFAIGENGEVAIKVIDDRGNELMVVKSVEEVE